MRGRLMLLEFVLVVLLLAVMPQRGFTQGDTTTCPQVVVQALQDLGQNCGGLDRNSACYGFNKVSALFDQNVADNFFTKPTDVSDLKIMQSIETAPLDTVLNQWGVAVLSVQANIPNTLPGQSARFILLGDVSVKNDVPADEAAAATAPPITVTTSIGANIRSLASSRANVLTSVPAGTDLQADAVSADKQWVRVTYGDATVGWMSREVIQANSAIDGLPLISTERRTPMQAFHFTTGVNAPNCEEAPSLLVVQGPDNVKIDINANGADIRLGSTIALYTQGGKFKLITVHGKAEVGGLTVPAGFGVEVGLDDKGNAKGDFGGFHLLTQGELDMLKTLENLPGNVLDYPIKLPDIQAITSAAPAAGQADCGAFKATSPVDGFSFGLNVFYWDAAPGATSYRVTVPGGGTSEVAAPTTTTTIDLSGAGFNPQMSWYVEALVNGKVACTSQTVTIPRESPPPEGSGAAPGSFPASWSCLRRGSGIFTVTFGSLPPGTTSVTINYSGPAHAPGSGTTFSVPPFSQRFSGTPGTMTGGSVVANPSGISAGLPGGISC